jgi:hypothetical protein
MPAARRASGKTLATVHRETGVSYAGVRSLHVAAMTNGYPSEPLVTTRDSEPPRFRDLLVDERPPTQSGTIFS